MIEIEGFIDAAEVHPTLYEAPYFAGPDGAVAGTKSWAPGFSGEPRVWEEPGTPPTAAL